MAEKPVTKVLPDRVVLPCGKEILLPKGCEVAPVPIKDAENIIHKVTHQGRTVLMHDAMDEHTVNTKIFQLTTHQHRNHVNTPTEGGLTTSPSGDLELGDLEVG